MISVIGGYRELAKAVRAEGAAPVLQISHAGRQTLQDWPDDQVPVAPSAVQEGRTGRTPRPLTIFTLTAGVSPRILRTDCRTS